MDTVARRSKEPSKNVQMYIRTVEYEYFRMKAPPEQMKRLIARLESESAQNPSIVEALMELKQRDDELGAFVRHVINTGTS